MGTVHAWPSLGLWSLGSDLAEGKGPEMTVAPGPGDGDLGFGETDGDSYQSVWALNAAKCQPSPCLTLAEPQPMLSPLSESPGTATQGWTWEAALSPWGHTRSQRPEQVTPRLQAPG